MRTRYRIVHYKNDGFYENDGFYRNDGVFIQNDGVRIQNDGIRKVIGKNFLFQVRLSFICTVFRHVF